MIRQIVEGVITWLPGVSSSDIPQPLPGGISIHLRSDTVGLESQGIVGAIPLNNGDTIQIIPKVGQVNFLRLLFKAEGNQVSLEREFDDFVKYSIDDEQNIGSIVAKRFFASLNEILRRSPAQGRKRARRQDDFAAGEIQVARTALNLATKRTRPVVSLVKNRTTDIPENRILSEALVRSWPLLSPDTQSTFRLIYEHWVRRFPRSQNIFRDLLSVDRAFATRGYGGARDYYRLALMLAKIILGTNGIGFGSKNEVAGDAILLNAADIYERYLRCVISDSHAEKGYVVTKGGAGMQSLYTDGSFGLIPDIVISKANAITLIADAKYKKPTAGDHYQMVAYLAAHKLKRGILLAPLFSGTTVVIKEFATPEKVIVREIYLPMSDLDATEEILSSLVERYSH